MHLTTKTERRNDVVSTFRRKSVPYLLAANLYLLTLSQSRSEDHVSVKWQNYEEEDGRIRVISKYVGVEKRLTQALTLKAHAVHDSLAGATPPGSPDEDGTVPLNYLDDKRDAGVVDLVWKRGTFSTDFQYSYSDESDFLSKGYAISQSAETQNGNRIFSYGASFIDDTVKPVFFENSESKESYDVFVGISETVTKNTVVTVNLTYSDFSGFLSDPYKLIRQNTEIVEGVFLPLTFNEDRPEGRVRRIIYGEVRHYVEPLDGALDFKYRAFNDTWGVESHTFDLEWYQKIGDKLVLRPKYRWYKQNAADFYFPDLDAADFVALGEPDGRFPHYSADYRLAKFRSATYGLKAVYQINDRLSVDIDFERYEMTTEDVDTPQAAFPSADILTIGSTLWF